MKWSREAPTNPNRRDLDGIVGRLMRKVQDLEERVSYLENYGVPKPKPSIIPTVKTGGLALIVSAIVTGIVQGLAQLWR